MGQLVILSPGDDDPSLRHGSPAPTARYRLRNSLARVDWRTISFGASKVEIKILISNGPWFHCTGHPALDSGDDAPRLISAGTSQLDAGAHDDRAVLGQAEVLGRVGGQRSGGEEKPAP